MPVACPDEPAPQHCPGLEYTRFLAQQAFNPQYHLRKIRFYRNFLEHWPHLPIWFAAPLAERAGRIRGEDSRDPSFPTSYLARSYLVFLGLQGYARFDYPWLLGAGQLIVCRPGAKLGRDFGVDALVDEAASLGFNRASANQAMYWSVNRIMLHTGVTEAAQITQAHIEEALEAIRRFGERTDLHQFYGTPDDYRQGAAKQWVTHLHSIASCAVSSWASGRPAAEDHADLRAAGENATPHAGRRRPLVECPSSDRSSGHGRQAGAGRPSIR